MRHGTLKLLNLVLCGLSFAPVVHGDTIVQQPGTDYLVIEAELFEYDDFNNPDTGWLIISPDDPQELPLFDADAGFITVPPPSANPSQRAAIFDQVGGGDFADQVGYALQFSNPGVYYLYVRYSLFDLRDFGREQLWQ